VTIRQAREAARRWIIEQASLPGFCGAYTAGSTNWIADDAELNATSDLDIMVLVADQTDASRNKFVFEGVLLDVTYLDRERFRVPEQVLSDYHLAPSFQSANVVVRPFADLDELWLSVCEQYAKPEWIRRRCRHAEANVLRHLASIGKDRPLHDQVMSCLFGAGVTAHILLTAGLRNPTVKSRYVAVRHLLDETGHGAFHKTMLRLLGSEQMSGERVRHHLSSLEEVFDAAAARAWRTKLPFAADISAVARPAAIDSGRELVDRRWHCEAMFWIAVTHSRCQAVLAEDAPERLMERFRTSYRDLLADLGLATPASIEKRRTEIEGALPDICDLAEAILSHQ